MTHERETNERVIVEPVADEEQAVVVETLAAFANEEVLIDTEAVEPKEEESQLEEETKPKGLFQCPQCSYCSHKKHYLKQHTDLVHSNYRPFKCPFCDYAGKRSHSLKQHLVVHSNDRPYECTECNASFRKKAHLTCHLKLHTGSAAKTHVNSITKSSKHSVNSIASDPQAGSTCKVFR